MKNYTIYTDGACKQNPGPGGWACILINKDTNIVEDAYGYHVNTTNNRMELTAVVRGLALTELGSHIELYSDSRYIINAINLHWLINWQSNGWKTSNGGDVKNKDLWEELLTLISLRHVKFNWVKGHSNNKYNEACDKRASSQAKLAKSMLE